MIIVNKTEDYVIFKPKHTLFEDITCSSLEKIVARLYAAEGRINFIVDLNEITVLCHSAVVLFDKIHKITLKETGVFITVVNNDSVMDTIADNSEFELLMLSSIDEAIEAVYLNASSNEFDAEEEDDYDMNNDY